MLTYENNVEAYFSELAKKSRLRYVSLLEIPINSFSLEKNKNTDYLRLQALPISETETTLTIATSNPTELVALNPSVTVLIPL